MKQKVKILHESDVIYEGRIADIPIKEDAIIQKSIDLFDDDDPCIIHQSYVIKEYVDQLLTLFNEHKVQELSLQQFSDIITFLDVEDPEHCTIVLEG